MEVLGDNIAPTEAKVNYTFIDDGSVVHVNFTDSNDPLGK